MQAATWLSSLVRDNLLAVIDVSADIHQERQLSGDIVGIPLFNQLVGFPELLPADTSGMRDRYCELRWKAAKLLEKHGAIGDVRLEEDGHRWESYIRLSVTDAFDTVRTAASAELSQRDEAEPPARHVAAAAAEGLPDNPRSNGPLQLPERVSLRWLAAHVPVGFWFWLAGSYVAVLLFGIKLADLPWVRQLSGTPAKSSAVVSGPLPSAPTETMSREQPLSSMALRILPNVSERASEQVINALRQEYKLRQLDTLEGGRPIGDAPDGTYCFASVVFLDSHGADGRDMLKSPCQRLLNSRHLYYEVFNPSQGQPLVLTFLSATDAASVTRLNGNTQHRVFVAPVPLRDATTLVLIPFSRIITTSERQIQLDSGGEVHGLDILLR